MAPAGKTELRQSTLLEHNKTTSKHNGRNSTVSLKDLDGIGAKTAENLRDAGYDSIESIAKSNEEELSSVDGVGKKGAKQILAAATKLWEEIRPKPTEKIKELSKLDGVGGKTAENLIYAGYDSVEVIANADEKELSSVSGVGKKGAKQILAAAKKLWREMKPKPTKKIAELKELDGVGGKTAENLIEAGYDTVESITKADSDELSSVPGVGKKGADQMLKSAKKLWRKMQPSAEDKIDELKTLDGVGGKTAESLISAGYDTIFKIADTSPSKLSKSVDGVGGKGAEQIVASAKQVAKTKEPRSEEEEETFDLVQLDGVGKKTAENLKAAGYAGLEKIATADTTTLTRFVTGVGDTGAEKIVASAQKAFRLRQAREVVSDYDLIDLEGVGEKTAQLLKDAGYTSIAEVAACDPDELANEVEGIGKKGASKVIQLASKTVSFERAEAADLDDVELTDLDGIGPKTAKSLVSKGYDSIAKIVSASPSDLAKDVNGIGKTGGEQLIETAKEVVDRGGVIEEQGMKVISGPRIPIVSTSVKKLKEARESIKRKDSGLDVPDSIENLRAQMVESWKETEELMEEAKEQEQEQTAASRQTMEVVALSAEETSERLVEEVRTVLAEAMTTGRPVFEIPSRSADNIVWDQVRDLLLLGTRKISRPYHSLGSVLDATRTARVIEIVYELLRDNLHATKREVFYSDVNLFRDQKYSDKIIEDVASMLQTTRDSIHVVASARGSAMGRVVLRDGGDRLDLTKMGTGGWSITPFLDQVEIVESDAEFIILSEKDAAMMRLAEAKYWERQPCIILTGKGTGDIATRAFLKMLVRELQIPAFALVDSDPYGHYIYSVFLRGSKRLSYESPFIATPELKLLGVLSRDLEEYNIPKAVRIRMEDSDIRRVKQMLDEPFVQKNKEWVRDLELMLKMKEKAEIQAFASHGFNYLTDDYLPRKIETGDWI
jgi:meiotic recombination protein SPO11